MLLLVDPVLQQQPFKKTALMGQEELLLEGLLEPPVWGDRQVPMLGLTPKEVQGALLGLEVPLGSESEGPEELHRSVPQTLLAAKA